MAVLPAVAAAPPVVAAEVPSSAQTPALGKAAVEGPSWPALVEPPLEPPEALPRSKLRRETDKVLERP